MDESMRLLGWLLRHTLERHYAGNKSLMAKDLDINRHTLWRTFRVFEGGKGHISFLIVKQLIYCCMLNNYSIDESIAEYMSQRTQENARKCQETKDWIHNVLAGSYEVNSRVLDMVKEVTPEWLIVFGCNHLNDPQDLQPTFCKFSQACPFLKLKEISQIEFGQTTEVS